MRGCKNIGREEENTHKQRTFPVYPSLHEHWFVSVLHTPFPEHVVVLQKDTAHGSHGTRAGGTSRPAATHASMAATSTRNEGLDGPSVDTFIDVGVTAVQVVLRARKPPHVALQALARDTSTRYVVHGCRKEGTAHGRTAGWRW